MTQPPPTPPTSPQSVTTGATTTASSGRPWLVITAVMTAGVAIAAFVFSVVSFVISQDTENRQAKSARDQNAATLIQQLRAQYPVIGKEELTSSTQLDTTLAVATNLLHEVGPQASGYDYFFIADAYRLSTHSEIAIPLYQEALSRLQQPFYRIETLRGLGAAQFDMGSTAAARRTFTAALLLTKTAGFAERVAADDNAITLQLWIRLESAAHRCKTIDRLVPAYFKSYKLTTLVYGRPTPADTAAVKSASASCTAHR